MQMDRTLEYRILKAWDKLKQQRLIQGFTSSNVRLIVKTVESNENEDRTDLELELQEELDEIIESHQMDYDIALSEYEQHLEEWNRSHSDESKLSQKSKKDQPRKPEFVAIEKDKKKKEILDHLLSTRKQPGAPNLTIVCAHTEPITDNVQCPKVNSTNFYIKKKHFTSHMTNQNLYINSKSKRAEKMSILRKYTLKFTTTTKKLPEQCQTILIFETLR